MHVRIVHKFADWLDGVDLRNAVVGAIVELPEAEARVVIAEGWAVPTRRAADAVSLQRDAPPKIVDRRFTQSRRAASAASGDLYQRLQDKRTQIEQDRRRFFRRSTDHPTSHAA